VGWGQDPDDDRDLSPGRGSDPARLPPLDPTRRRDPHMRRNPLLGRDPQWGREPGRGSLRPLNLTDVLDGMFRVLRSHWRAFAVGLSVVVVPMALVSSLVFAQMFGTSPGLLDALQDPALVETAAPTLASADELARGALAGALSVVVSVLLTPLIYGIAVRVAASGYRAGEVDAMESVRAAGRRYPALLGASLLSSLIIGAIVAVPFILVGITAAAQNVAGVGIAIVAVLAGAVFAVVAGIRMALFVPAIVVEQVGATQALRRSNELVRGRTAMTLGTLVVVGIVVTIAGSIVSSLITNSLFGVAFVLIYFDRRVRAEGYDLSELAAELEERADPRW
jgi:hypothetical protein